MTQAEFRTGTMQLDGPAGSIEMIVGAPAAPARGIAVVAHLRTRCSAATRRPFKLLPHPTLSRVLQHAGWLADAANSPCIGGSQVHARCEAFDECDMPRRHAAFRAAPAHGDQLLVRRARSGGAASAGGLRISRQLAVPGAAPLGELEAASSARARRPMSAGRSPSASRGVLRPVVMTTRGSRARAIESGELHIDVRVRCRATCGPTGQPERRRRPRSLRTPRLRDGRRPTCRPRRGGLRSSLPPSAVPDRHLPGEGRCRASFSTTGDAQIDAS